MTSNWKEFYAFANFRSDAAAKMLSLKIKSVNFNVNIFSDYSGGYRSIGKNMFDDIPRRPLFLSISNSIISTPSHAVNLSDLTGYENVSINVEDSIIQNGGFMFKNKRESCEPTGHVKNIVEINNVTVLSSGIEALSVNGCFNMSINKLTCCNLTWKKQELFKFRGASIKMKNILIKDVLPDSKKSEGKALILVQKCEVEIQNVRIKDCKAPSSIWLHGTLSVFLLQNSLVKMRNMEVNGNSLQNLVRVESSFLCINNISLSDNIFNGTLGSIEKSNLKLMDAVFQSNTVGSLFNITLNSNVLITNNILSWNEILMNGYSVVKSIIQVINVAITGNSLMQAMLHVTSGSNAIIQNNTLTNNNVSKAVFNLFGKSRIQLNDIVFTRNKLMQPLLYMESNSRAIIKNKILTENIVSRAVYIFSDVSTIQLLNVTFTRNKLMNKLLYMESNSSAIIENNILTENNVTQSVYGLFSMSTIQLYHVTFTRNKLMTDLLYMESNSSAIIENNIFTENNVTQSVYGLFSMSTIQLLKVTFTRNNLMKYLLYMKSNSSAIIENNILTENNVTQSVYGLFSMSTIQLHHVTFTRNKLMTDLLYMESNSSAIIENNVFTENNVTQSVYGLFSMSTIQLLNVTFTRNNLMKYLLYMKSNSSAIIENNILTENNVTQSVYGLFSMSTIQLHHVTFTRNKLMTDLLYMESNSSAIIENNIFTENNVTQSVYGVSSMSTIQLHHVTFTRNKLMKYLLYMKSNSRAIIKNNIVTENFVSSAVYVFFDVSTIQLLNVTFTRNKLMNKLLYLDLSCSAIVKNNTIVGNNMHGPVFYVHSANFVMHTISVENNTVTEYFIWASFSSNVSLDLLRIKENRFRNGIIHIQNCASRLANTYIENYDRFSVSAISVISRYEGHKYFPFELKNNTIIWYYELSLSKRPIIELTGRIITSNVIISVSSITDIEVLRYSTKDVIVDRPYYKVFSNVYEISALFISCRRANVKHIATFDTVRCIPCARDTYTLHNGSLNISSRHLADKKHRFQKEGTNLTCYNCPVGANCTEHIKSKSNFYGYITQQQKVKFLPCPLNFCCTTDQCKTITSCNKGRSGTLCGRCSGNNTESFLSTNCIPVNWCQNIGIYWLIYCVYALTLATCLYYMKDLIVLMKTAGGKVLKVFKCFRKEKKMKVRMMNRLVLSEAKDTLRRKHRTSQCLAFFH